MFAALLLGLALLLLSAEPTLWLEGEHLTGDWGGARSWLAEHGVTFDIVWAGEVFNNAASTSGTDGLSLVSHLDVALTLDTGKLGLWPGGRFYVLAQNGLGRGINESVGSVTQISNLEAPPYTQLGEFFFEQSLFDEVLRIRLGKQDANREFGSPRFGGNFINNNFGMFPSAPLPSYPTNGLGAAVIVQPLWWLSAKLVLFEGNPQIGSLGFDSALARDAGTMLVGGVAVSHHLPDTRSGGISSLGVWRQTGKISELSDDVFPRTFGDNVGFFVQNDERFYANPGSPDDQTGATFITRFGWSQPDRNLIALYAGASLAWHGLGPRADDTIGLGFGWFTVAQQTHGAPGPGAELYVEAFYKWRLTRFLSLEPDCQYLVHPGGDGPDALLVGARLKLKL